MTRPRTTVHLRTRETTEIGFATRYRAICGYTSYRRGEVSKSGKQVTCAACLVRMRIKARKDDEMRSRFEGKTPDEMMGMLEHGNINERAACLALRYGMIDGAHHKQWVIDQMLRLICGAGYTEIMAIYNSDEDCDEWDTGVAP